MEIETEIKEKIDGSDTGINNNLTDDQKEVLNAVNIPDILNIQINNAETISEEAIQMNNAFELTRKIYQDVLSPQLEENEILKRKHKDILMDKIFKILKWQFIFTYVFVGVLVISTIFSSILSISENVISNVIKFAEYYITSIVVELLSILFFIVKNVFDKSIVDLIKNFDKYMQNKSKEQEK